MTRWDPGPTPFQRWMVRHAQGLRTGLVLAMIGYAGLAVLVLATDGFVLAVLGPVGGIWVSFMYLRLLRGLEVLVSNHDAPRPEEQNPG